MACPDTAKAAHLYGGDLRNSEQLAGPLGYSITKSVAEYQGPPPSSPELRDYQHDVIAAFDREVATGSKRVLMVAPTAAGKTCIAADIVRRAREQGRSVLVVAHSREIIIQTSAELKANGIRNGMILAGTDPRPLERVQVASVASLWTRAFRSSAMQLPLADLLVIDECHHATANTYRKIIEAYPRAVLLGLTATPCRGDGRGLGGIFDVMVQCPQVPELIDLGFLVKSVVYAPVDPDLSGVATRSGDFAENQLAERMDRPKLIGDMVTHWHKFGQWRATVAFCVGVEHSLHARDEFCRSGVTAEHIDGNTPKGERDAILARLASGETKVVTNCMVLTEGWNLPSVSCCILARPTKMMGLYRQMVGRVLRPAPGKTDAIILDHSGAVYRHGAPEDRVEWTLDPDSHAVSPAHQARKQKSGGGLIECAKCSALRVGGQPCPHCGFMPVRQGQPVQIEDGELTLFKNGRAAAAPVPTQQERIKFHAELRGVAQQRGYKSGWAAQQFKTKFGGFPPWEWNDLPTCTPSAVTLSWVRSRQIAYAKRRQA